MILVQLKKKNKILIKANIKASLCMVLTAYIVTLHIKGNSYSQNTK